MAYCGHTFVCPMAQNVCLVRRDVCLIRRDGKDLLHALQTLKVSILQGFSASYHFLPESVCFGHARLLGLFLS